MKEIPLTQGMVVVVDDEDFEELSKYKWYTSRNGKVANLYYAVRKVAAFPSGYITVLMHRQIMNPKSIQVVDHIDHNGLHNCRINLRVCTHRQNLLNSRNQGKYKGVTWCKRDKIWAARVTLNGKSKRIGSFTDPIAAAKAYDKAAKELHGTFAYLNFPED